MKPKPNKQQIADAIRRASADVKLAGDDDMFGCGYHIHSKLFFGEFCPSGFETDSRKAKLMTARVKALVAIMLLGGNVNKARIDLVDWLPSNPDEPDFTEWIRNYDFTK